MGSKSRTNKKRCSKTHQQYEEKLIESDDTFAFVAGYTSWGFPYGITWEEMEEIEGKEEEVFGNKRPACNDKEWDLPFC